jgi:alkylation response protein AidB-like acyl-CoA dehydrogenase
MMIVDMKSPGITVRPIIDIRGAHMLNEVFFDDVRVPATQLVGEENRGWDVVMAALNIERTAGATTGDSKRVLEELVRYTKETQHHGEPLCRNPLVRHKLANIAVEIEVVRLLAYKIAWTETQGLISPVDASAAKILGTESRQRLVAAGMEILGPGSQLRPGSKWAKLQGVLIDMQFMSFIGRFGGGTNEIQRNIIAWMGLGLPRP